jgi:hypothetical protein
MFLHVPLPAVVLRLVASGAGMGIHGSAAAQDPNASARPPRHNSLLYGRYSVRFKADPLAGFKIAWLLWPDSGVWPRDGEIDFPEGELDLTIYGAAHAGTDSAEIFDSKMPFGCTSFCKPSPALWAVRLLAPRVTSTSTGSGSGRGPESSGNPIPGTAHRPATFAAA